MDPFKYCLTCNPDDNWMELEFRSQQNKPIDGLNVKIALVDTAFEYSATTYNGKAFFPAIPAGEYRITVSTDSLLGEVEKYASRDANEVSPVEQYAQEDKDYAQERDKEYSLATIGDFWDEPPVDDEFLMEHHQAIDALKSDKYKGHWACHNHTYVFEIKALRSHIPYIVDTDEYSLVNSYTFALLARLAYASDETDLDDGTTSSREGAIETVITSLKAKEPVLHTADVKANWLVEEVPYSQALNFKYYAYKDIGAEGYLLYNDEIVILGARGTEPYFTNGDKFNDNAMWQVVKNNNGFGAIVNSAPVQAAVGTFNVLGSSGFKDLIETDLDSAQIPIEEFGNTYVHQGFYRYTMALWNGNDEQCLFQDILEQHKDKFFYICGHSLGGASATLLSALIKEKEYASGIRLYTYGSPRTGTRSFVERYKSIVHHRHVNDHDLVPQIPMRWLDMNGVAERTYHTVKALISGCLGQFVHDGSEILKDQDNDNYHHHGQLTQLLNYTPDQQVLLTPRQTHMPILDAIKMSDSDSYKLLDKVNADMSMVDQIGQHGMNVYIPNIAQLLKMLMNTSLKDHYTQAFHRLSDIEQQMLVRYQNTRMEKANMAGVWHYNEINKARYLELGQQIDVTHDVLVAFARIKEELRAIAQNPELMPTEKLLVANQSLPQHIKDQICQL